MIYFLKKMLRLGNLPYRYDQIYEIISESQPRNIMEIGVWTGERAKKMIHTASRYNALQEVAYFGFDLFEKMDDDTFAKEVSKQPPSLNEVKYKLEKTGARINLFKGDTNVSLPSAVEYLPKMDFVFIDGGHSLETIANDWNNVEKLLSKGSIVVFDDYWSDRVDAGAKPTVDGIDRAKYVVEILPVKDYFKETTFGPLGIQLVKVTKI